jgi:hypothetical protein
MISRLNAGISSGLRLVSFFPRAGLIQRLARLDQLDLLDPLGGQYRDPLERRKKYAWNGGYPLKLPSSSRSSAAVSIGAAQLFPTQM